MLLRRLAGYSLPLIRRTPRQCLPETKRMYHKYRYLVIFTTYNDVRHRGVAIYETPTHSERNFARRLSSRICQTTPRVNFHVIARPEKLSDI